MTLQPTSKADPVGKQRGFIRHQTFMFMLAFPLILLGSSSIFYNKASHGAPHFTTWHSVRLFAFSSFYITPELFPFPIRMRAYLYLFNAFDADSIDRL
jgi:hypothetical protein